MRAIRRGGVGFTACATQRPSATALHQPRCRSCQRAAAGTHGPRDITQAQLSRCARAHPHGVHGAGARQTGATWLLSSRLKVCDVTVNHHLCTGPQRRAEQQAARATATALARRSAPHAPAPSLLLLRASAAHTQAHAARNLRVVHDSLSVRGLLMRASARLNQFCASCVCVPVALFLSLCACASVCRRARRSHRSSSSSSTHAYSVARSRAA